MNENFELKLQAWLDGELSAAEARPIGGEANRDTDAGRLAAQLRSVKDALAGNEMTRSVPDTREFYWSKIEREIERQARGSRTVTAPRQPVWRRWVSPFLGFAGLACMLVLAVKPLAPPTFDEISAMGDGMEAVTFNDQAAGMTVVWLTDTAQTQAPQSPVVPVTPDTGDSETELE